MDDDRGSAWMVWASNSANQFKMKHFTHWLILSVGVRCDYSHVCATLTDYARWYNRKWELILCFFFFWSAVVYVNDFILRHTFNHMFDWFYYLFFSSFILWNDDTIQFGSWHKEDSPQHTNVICWYAINICYLITFASLVICCHPDWADHRLLS